ncbi:MAG: GTPase Era [Candidatus Omnitrophica bacterium]|nr:GTPase Era [Candidatus Omnitrophota bacterium]MCM8808897.1 GTPase Era [Candidatus Omnitrophota bacterium]
MKTGYVTILGRPNVGKSTLLNTILKQKISIVSPKPATTRIKVIGIYNDDRGQIIFIDTPGFEEGKNEMGKFMLKSIYSSLEETDIILFLIEATGWIKEDEKIIEVLKKINKEKVILGINKIDILKYKEELLPLIDESIKKFNFIEVVPFSALKNKNIDSLIKAIFIHLPESDRFYPVDMTTNLPFEYQISEIIREKILQKTYQEVPHSAAVEIEEIKEGEKNKDILVIKANIIVDRENLKSIIIGKDGKMIKTIGKLAREEIELIVGKKVYLELKVKVIEDWRNKIDVFRKFGYGNI